MVRPVMPALTRPSEIIGGFRAGHLAPSRHLLIKRTVLFCFFLADRQRFAAISTQRTMWGNSRASWNTYGLTQPEQNAASKSGDGLVAQYRPGRPPPREPDLSFSRIRKPDAAATESQIAQP